MKKILVIAAFIAFGTVSYAQDTAQTKTEKVVEATKATAKKVGKGVKKGATVVGEEVSKDAKVVGAGTKKVAKKVAHGTEKAYDATKEKVQEVTKKKDKE